MTTHQNRKLRLVIYTRVSTVGQLDGYGLPAQEKDCRRWNSSPAGGHRIVHVVREEALTGKSTVDEREALMDAMSWITEGKADGILAPNLDRLARELTVQEAILSYVWALGGAVFTADHGEHLEDDESDPMRTAMRQMRGVFGQLERGLIRKRLRDGRNTKAELGGYAYGAPRFGQQAIDGELVDDTAELEVAALAEGWKAEGLGVREICRRLNAAGHRSKRGGDWHPTTVARLLDGSVRATANEKSAAGRARKKEELRRTRAAKILGGIG